jgi:hypothetical protein
LRAAGVEVPCRDGEVEATLEISPLYAATEEQLKARRPQLMPVEPGSRLYLGEHGVEKL